MDLSKQACTLEQSKKLKALGVRYEASLSVWHQFQGYKYMLLLRVEDDKEDTIPGFTLSELGLMLPAMYISGYRKDKCSAICCFYEDAAKPRHIGEVSKWEGKGETEAEARAAMLIYLLENNHTTPEEVNTRLNNI